MANNYYKPHVWNAYCDVCGFKFKSDQMKLRWDNARVCEECWEPRNEQDFLRARKELSSILPWSKPDTGGIDVSPSYIMLFIDAGYYVDGPNPTNLDDTYYEEL
jgi:hypothetical protein